MKLKTIFFGLLIIISSSLVGADRYTSTYISPSYWKYNSFPARINNNGQVAGVFENVYDAHQAFTWDHEEGYKALDFVTHEFPEINNFGDVAGTFEANNSKMYMFIQKRGEKDPQIINAPEGKTWSSERLHILSYADDGSILLSNYKDVKSETTEYAIWRDGKYTVTKVESFIPVIMNNSSQIVGYYLIEENVRIIAILDLITNEYTPIDIKDGVPYDINEQGAVCGIRGRKGFLWTPENGLQLLDNFLPIALNNNNQMLGFALSDSDAYSYESIWDKGELKYISRDLLNVKYCEYYLYDINDRGQIVAAELHTHYDGQQHEFITVIKGVILNPVD
jgi:hypothetical protein